MIDLEIIEEVYGKSVVSEIVSNKEKVLENLKCLERLNFSDIENIFERVPLLFLSDNNEFKNKMDSLVIKLGQDYVNIIESDLSILENL